MIQIPATCVVDELGGMQYAVEVTGALAWADHRRTYTLKATSEKEAAMQAMQDFSDEIEALQYAEQKDD